MMRHVPPEALNTQWERVRAGLLVVMENSVEDWLPEDVYMSIKINQSSLYIIEDTEYRGFAVLQVLPMFHGKKLHVWCSYAATKRPILRAMLKDLKVLAASVGAKKISFTSPRDEWAVAAGKGDFKATQTTYELVL